MGKTRNEIIAEAGILQHSLMQASIAGNGKEYKILNDKYNGLMKILEKDTFGEKLIDKNIKGEIAKIIELWIAHVNDNSIDVARKLVPESRNEEWGYKTLIVFLTTESQSNIPKKVKINYSTEAKRDLDGSIWFHVPIVGTPKEYEFRFLYEKYGRKFKLYFNGVFR